MTDKTEREPVGEVLVVGGGIAGMQAALLLAELGLRASRVGADSYAVVRRTAL